jgi:hypothetical protein
MGGVLWVNTPLLTEFDKNLLWVSYQLDYMTENNFNLKTQTDE